MPCVLPEAFSVKDLSMPDDVSSDIENVGYKITITDRLEGNLDRADILYLTLGIDSQLIIMSVQ
ncbi:Aspartate carbamoyltransferase (fragment) [Shewanella benthica]|uniref:Aspartate carbamoyltransferase n=1 Tax=Shewanella benthica TaxID=43661 RepID=A0A330M3E4_9GAMM